jgi:tRNA nucleotidyltransferase/poly(A) polymerase
MNPRSQQPEVELPAPGDALRGLLARAPLPQISALAAAHEGRVYLVGGALRDAMLGRDVADLDIAVATRLEDFLRAVAAATGRYPAPIGDRWRQTHRLRWHGIQLDLALLLGPLEADLGQRDFTVNAMALPLPAPADSRAALVDPHGGQRDLKARRIRCVSEAVLDADPLRLLRAVRYVAALPDFDLDPASAESMMVRADRIAEVAPERVQTEWTYLLTGERWVAGTAMARRFGLAERSFAVVPDLAMARAWSQHGDEAALSAGHDLEPLVARLAAVLCTDVRARGAEAVLAVLLAERWPARLARRAVHAAMWTHLAPGSDERELAEWVLEDRGAAALAAELAAAHARSQSSPVPAAVSNLRVLAERACEPRWVTGRDLRTWGMDEGPGLGAVLAETARGQLLRRWDSAERASAWARERAALACHRTGGGTAAKDAEDGR